MSEHHATITWRRETPDFGQRGLADPRRAVRRPVEIWRCLPAKLPGRLTMIPRLLRKAAVVLASGYILFFLSERVFWSFWRPGDNPAEFLITWLAYSLIGWIYLDLVRRFRVAKFPAVFLCGAVYGWVAEGIVVDTMYGDPTNPFPLSLSWTGLAWHALLTRGRRLVSARQGPDPGETRKDGMALSGNRIGLGAVGCVVAKRNSARMLMRPSEGSPVTRSSRRSRSSCPGSSCRWHAPTGSGSARLRRSSYGFSPPSSSWRHDSRPGRSLPSPCLRSCRSAGLLYAGTLARSRRPMFSTTCWAASVPGTSRPCS